MSGLALLQGQIIDPSAPPVYQAALAGRKAPVSVDSSGRLVISGAGGTLVVSGAQTPGDAVANPTDCVDVRNFLEGFDGANWRRLRVALGTHFQSLGSDYFLRTAGPAMLLDAYYAGTGFTPQFAEWLGVAAGGNAYAGRVTVQAPHAFTGLGACPLYRSTSLATSGVAKASRARLLALRVAQVDGSGPFFCVLNQTTAPVGGETPVFVLPAAAGLTLQASERAVGREFFGDSGLDLSSGFAWAWSTSHTSVVFGVAPSAAQIQASYT